MTWSIVARDERTGRVGIIVATRFLAVGSRVPHIRSGIGAVASQALFNPFYGPQALSLSQAGASAEDALRLLTKADEGRDHRQVHMMDRQGRSAGYTGAACVDWAGHQVHDGFSAAGNMLAGPEVLESTVDAYKAKAALPFARRLIAAMHAGEAAGGDKRGKQSAALLIHDEQDYSMLDLRIDDHVDPLAELARLESVARERWVHFRRALATRDNPSGLVDRTDLDALITQSIASGYE